MKWFIFFTCTMSLFVSCSSPRRFSDRSDNDITSSLFDYKERSITEQDIQRILSGRIKLPDTLRVAVYRDPNSSNEGYRPYWLGYDEAKVKADQAIMDSISTALLRTGRVSKVIAMPSMIVGKSPNIHQLRESAVRLQADLLLIYAVKSDLYQQYKALKKDEAKAYASCQSVIMDIRTGVIPHTEVITREFLGKKEAKDLNRDVMRRRVQEHAVLLAIGATGRSMEQYLVQEQRGQ